MTNSIITEKHNEPPCLSVADLNGPITCKRVRPFLVLAQHCRVKCNYEQHRQGVARMHSVQNAWSRFSKLNQ